MKKLLALLLCLLLLTGCTATIPETTEPSSFISIITVPTLLPTEPVEPTTEATEPTTEPTEPPTEPTEPPTEATEPSTEGPQPTQPPESEPEPEPEPEPKPDSGLQVHFIDVGQADCSLIECNGEFALIDGGNTEDGSLVVDYLAQQGVDELELVVGTHPHEDHIGGIPDVLNTFPAETVWSSHIPYQNYIINAFLEAVSDAGLTLQQPENGYTFDLGGASLTVLGPVHTDYEDLNDLSLVILVQYGSTRFLFTGDMEQTAETDLIESGADLKADVLKVGHHGSYTSTGYRLLREVAPTYAVISCGAGNEYGHPHDAPLSRLQDAEVTIYRTDRMYNIVAASDGENITFTWDNIYAEPWIPA